MRSLLLFAALATAPASAAPAPPTGAPLYDEEVLANGLRVILMPHHANPMIASAVVVGAGVVEEPAAAAGASHFLEHLLFNGTTTRSQRQLYDDADRIGAYNNATTREDHTLFTLLVAREHAEEGLAIQADMLFRSTIPAENFDKERKIVLEELSRDRTDPSYDVEAAFREFAFAGTPIARPVLGTEASLAGITRDQVVAYYKAFYVPANMTLVVMGDFEPAEMKAIVGRTFGAAKKAPRPPSVPARWPQPPAENFVASASSAPSMRLLAATPFDLAPWDRTMVAAQVLLAAVSEGEDAPLRRALARRGIEPISVSVGIEPRARPWSTLTFDATLPEGADPRAALDALAEAFAQTGPDGEARRRVERIVGQERADAVIARDQIHYFVLLRSATVLGAPEGSLGAATRQFDTLGPADWDAASTRLLAALPALRARAVGAGLTEARSTWRVPPTPAPVPSAALATGAFENGLRYVVSASDDSDVFALHVAFAPRAASEPEGRDGITDLLHRMMGRGSLVRDEAALEDRLARLGARLKLVDDPAVPFDDYYTTPEFSWIRLEVPASQWREAVGIVAEIVRFPAFTPASLDASRAEMQEIQARGAASPRSVASGRLDALLAPGNPVTRPVYGSSATLAAITLDDVKAFHASTVVGRRAIVSVVGPVDADEVVRALRADFGGLPSGDPPAEIAAVEARETPASAEAVLGKSQAYLAMGEVIDVPPGDRAALTIAVAMLSDRLAFDLRETKGLAYSVGASLRAWGGRTRFDVTIGTRADNLDEARSGILSGIATFRSETPSAADVSRAINAARGTALMRRMTRISLAYEAGLEALRGRAPGDERRFVDALTSVTADDVRRVAQTYLDPQRLSQVTVK